ncbi:MAG TPA: hypothetical protein P5234_10415 [Thermoanaerobaculaceae bacterium]|nr:hypothetical protein [Thermoanaerobaculaceae bacterium]HRS16641.1 hypothetical protein [Thermoanaerobaculaceae bacterium]
MADQNPAAGPEPASRLPLSLLLAFGWLVPGLGHLLLRRRLRAAVFFTVIMVAFVVGILLQGELILPRAGDPLSYVAAIAIIGNGVPFFAARYLGLGHGVVTAASYEFGNTFLLTAGMMNLLLLLDIFEIYRGHKEW